MLDDYDILMYSTHNRDKLIVPERFIRTLKVKIYKIMTSNGSKSYLRFSNKSVDEYNNTYHCSIGKKSIDAIILFCLKKLNRVIKLLNLKLVTELKLLTKRIFLAKVTPKIGQEEYLLLILCWKLIPGRIKLKI